MDLNYDNLGDSLLPNELTLAFYLYFLKPVNYNVIDCVLMLEIRKHWKQVRKELWRVESNGGIQKNPRFLQFEKEGRKSYTLA